MCDVGRMKAVNMKRNLAATILLGLLLVLAAACPGGSNDGEPSASGSDTVDPAVWEALEEQAEIEVYISLRKLDIPLDEQTTEMRREHASNVQARVLRSLTAADISSVHELRFTPAISATITASGLEKAAVKALRTNRDKRAERLFQEAIAAGTRNPNTYHQYAGLLLDKKKRDEAIEQWKRAIELDPLTGEYYYALGKAMKKGNRAESERLIALAREVDPEVER